MRPTFTTGTSAAKVNTVAMLRKTQNVSRMLFAENSVKLSAQSPPCNRKALPSDTRASAEVRLRASPANTSGGWVRSRASTAAKAAASGYSGTWRIGICRQLDGLQGWATAHSLSLPAYTRRGPALPVRHVRHKKKGGFRPKTHLIRELRQARRNPEGKPHAPLLHHGPCGWKETFRQPRREIRFGFSPILPSHADARELAPLPCLVSRQLRNV